MLSASFEDDDHDDMSSQELPVHPPKLRKTETLIVEEKSAIGLLARAVALRQKYCSLMSATPSAELMATVAAGRHVAHTFDASGLLQLQDDGGHVIASCGVQVEEFADDYASLSKIVSDGKCRTYSHHRLELLQQRFELHETMQGDMEMREMGRGEMAAVDFFSVGKVDNHIHLAAAFHASTFSAYVKSKLADEAHTIVTRDGGVGKSLSTLFAEAGLDASCLGLDAFHLLADHSLYQRFDRFNDRYNPMRQSRMRTIFLKSSNAIDGRFFGELTRQLLDNAERKLASSQTTMELRISIYGIDRGEWGRLAKWVLTPWLGATGLPARPLLSEANRWIIQIPRLYSLFRGKTASDGTPQVAHFQVMLEHIFAPLVEATLRPEANPQLAELLSHVVAFDSVDDESNPEQPVDRTSAANWSRPEQPNYSWQLYMLYGNLVTLNALRRAKGLNTIALRPHCGESGDPSHLAGAYLCAASINHGIRLSDSAVLQYLYYLDQVGLSISPISNHFLFLKARKSPFPQFFKRGLNVTLSTDDPMLFHLSEDPLLEEYTTARTAYDLSMLDMCEIARNSVLQSGFEDARKRAWLGDRFEEGLLGCAPSKCNVTPSRATFRGQLLQAERALLQL
jgi:AMP deaminase